MRTVEYLDAIQRQHNIRSDFELSRRLQITRSAVSSYRQGKTFLHDDVALRVAAMLGIHAGLVLIDMYAERTQNPVCRSVWHDVKEVFAGPSKAQVRERRSQSRLALV